jgi:hypothetical protein
MQYTRRTMMAAGAALATPSLGLVTIDVVLAQRAPQTAADVTAPAAGVTMHPEYAKAVGRMAYIWGWPMVNQINRRAAITQAPEPGRLNGVLPVAPRGCEIVTARIRRAEGGHRRPSQQADRGRHGRG